jgi:hypothetical protein
MFPTPRGAMPIVCMLQDDMLCDTYANAHDDVMYTLLTSRYRLSATACRRAGLYPGPPQCSPLIIASCLNLLSALAPIYRLPPAPLLFFLLIILKIFNPAPTGPIFLPPFPDPDPPEAFTIASACDKTS